MASFPFVMGKLGELSWKIGASIIFAINLTQLSDSEKHWSRAFATSTTVAVIVVAMVATIINIVEVVAAAYWTIVIIKLIATIKSGSSTRKIAKSSIFRYLQFVACMMKFITAGLPSSFCGLLLGFLPTLRKVLSPRQWQRLAFSSWFHYRWSPSNGFIDLDLLRNRRLGAGLVRCLTQRLVLKGCLVDFFTLLGQVWLPFSMVLATQPIRGQLALEPPLVLQQFWPILQTCLFP